MSDPPAPRPDATPSATAPCAACGKPLADSDAAACAICRRRVCAGCLRPYGHHMLACDECRLEPW